MIKILYFILLILCIFNDNLYSNKIATVSKPNITRNALPEKASLVIDCSNLRRKPIILYQQSANEIRHPASLTKIMTIYLLLEAIQNGKVKLNTKFTVSKFASKQMPSKLNLKVGEKISVLDCIKALLVKSANDVAVVVAEGLCGSVSEFCKVMNKKAKFLGMRNTHYENPSGVPNKKQVTCANDVAILGVSLMKKFPQYWHLFSLKKFNYKEKEYDTHCKILRWYNAADGAKTGYICASGFNLWVTATKYNKAGKARRLCAVIFGERSGRERDFKAARLLDNYFQDYTIITQRKDNNILNKQEKTLDNKKINNSKASTDNKSTNKKNQKRDLSNIHKIDNISLKNDNTKAKKNINIGHVKNQEDQNIKIKDTSKMSNTKLKSNNDSIANDTKKKQTSNITKTNTSNKHDNTNLQNRKKHNKLIANIDKCIDDVLQDSDKIQNNTYEEDVVYEIESFPMDDIIQSSGKSKEYFDDLYKDDIPLQIESSTPIDFSSNNKKQTTESSKKSNKDKNKKNNGNKKQKTTNRNIKNSKENKHQNSDINNKQKAINNNIKSNKTTKNQTRKLLPNNKNKNNKLSIENNNKIYTNADKTNNNKYKLNLHRNKSESTKNKLPANSNNIKDKKIKYM